MSPGYLDFYNLGNEMESMLSIRSNPLYNQVEKPAKCITENLDAIVDLLLKLSNLMLENQEIKEIDLNPTFAFDDGIAVADARFIL